MARLEKNIIVSQVKIKLLSSMGKIAPPVMAESEKFAGEVADAIVEGHNSWRMQAHFQGIAINGPVVIAGKLEGPDLAPLILARPPKTLKTLGTTLFNAIAKGIGLAWKEFQAGVSPAGSTWYPSFTAVPSPMAPPTPNIPTPMMTCAKNQQALTPAALKSRMMLGLAGQKLLLADEFVEGFAHGFSQAAIVWLSAQQITQVIGQGPVPTFAPPYVPVGSVAGGFATAAPGHLM